jgi:RNA polymerase sigma-70 factor (ECF subfamily)
MGSKFTEKVLLVKAKNKDPEAFAKVYDMYIDRLYRFIFFKVSDVEIAQDFAAETFLKAWEYIQSGKKIDNLNALLYRIARNLVIDHYRKKSNADIALDHEILDSLDLDTTVEKRFADKIQAKIEFEEILLKMEDLKEEYREILMLKYVEGYDIKDIAAIMDKKAGAVRVTLHRAGKALQELLED